MKSSKEFKTGFLDFCGQENAKLAFLLNLIEPRCGGVLIAGKKGTGKSTLLKAFRDIVRIFNMPFVELPMNATEEAVLGGIDFEGTIKTGERRFQRGLLSKADGGFLIIEDINLFPYDILSIIFEVQSRGENIIEREGITFREFANFQILATMNPEEADFSSHFIDRFGMCVIMDDIRDMDKRKEIVKLNISEESTVREEYQLIKKIQNSKAFFNKVKVPDEIIGFICELVSKEAVFGHRADIFLYYASKSYCAYLEEENLTEDHVKAVVSFVLNHRRRILEPESEEKEHEHEPEMSDDLDKKKKQNDKEQKISLSETQESHYGKSQNIPSSEKEEVFPIGESYKIKRLTFRKDRVDRDLTGRRTKTKTKGRGGRYIRSLIKERPDIAIDATLRASAPFQKLRGMKDKVVIYDYDLRYKEKERKMSHIVIFVVDGSGSMGVEQRMIASKGAVLSLLMDCYQKRDKVSMIVFRKDKAETILPPTSSVELALKRLKEIPTGGKTPLGAGLFEAYKMIKKMNIKQPESRFLILLLTDGKANMSISGKPPFEELQGICFMLKDFPYTDFVVIDAENKDSFIKMDLAFRIAQWLEARYFLMEELKAENLIQIANFFRYEL